MAAAVAPLQPLANAGIAAGGGRSSTSSSAAAATDDSGATKARREEGRRLRLGVYANAFVAALDEDTATGGGAATAAVEGEAHKKQSRGSQPASCGLQGDCEIRHEEKGAECTGAAATQQNAQAQLADGKQVVGGGGRRGAAAAKPAANVELRALRTEVTPEMYARFARDWRRAGASVIGGCCGVGPAHIRELRRALLEEDGKDGG